MNFTNAVKKAREGCYIKRESWPDDTLIYAENNYLHWRGSMDITYPSINEYLATDWKCYTLEEVEKLQNDPNNNIHM